MANLANSALGTWIARLREADRSLTLKDSLEEAYPMFGDRQGRRRAGSRAHPAPPRSTLRRRGAPCAAAEHPAPPRSTLRRR
jgi:hypothetical protein